MALLIGVPTETAPAEKRVATVPDVVEKLRKLGFSVAVQSGAGDASTSPTTRTERPGPTSLRPRPTSGPGRTSCSRCVRRALTRRCCGKAAR